MTNTNENYEEMHELFDEQPDEETSTFDDCESRYACSILPGTAPDDPTTCVCAIGISQNRTKLNYAIETWTAEIDGKPKIIEVNSGSVSGLNTRKDSVKDDGIIYTPGKIMDNKLGWVTWSLTACPEGSSSGGGGSGGVCKTWYDWDSYPDEMEVCPGDKVRLPAKTTGCPSNEDLPCGTKNNNTYFWYIKRDGNWEEVKEKEDNGEIHKVPGWCEYGQTYKSKIVAKCKSARGSINGDGKYDCCLDNQELDGDTFDLKIKTDVECNGPPPEPIEVEITNCPKSGECGEPGHEITFEANISKAGGPSHWTGQWYRNGGKKDGKKIDGETGKKLTVNYPNKPGNTATYCYYVERIDDKDNNAEACCEITTCDEKDPPPGEIAVSIPDCPGSKTCEPPSTPHTIEAKVKYDGEWKGQWFKDGKKLDGEVQAKLKTNYPNAHGRSNEYCFVVEDKDDASVTNVDRACCILYSCEKDEQIEVEILNCPDKKDCGDPGHSITLEAEVSKAGGSDKWSGQWYRNGGKKDGKKLDGETSTKLKTNYPNKADNDAFYCFYVESKDNKDNNAEACCVLYSCATVTPPAPGEIKVSIPDCPGPDVCEEPSTLHTLIANVQYDDKWVGQWFKDGKKLNGETNKQLDTNYPNAFGRKNEYKFVVEDEDDSSITDEAYCTLYSCDPKIAVAIENCPEPEECQEASTPYTIKAEVDFPNNGWIGQWYANDIPLVGKTSKNLDTTFPPDPDTTVEYCFIVQDKDNPEVSDEACCSLTSCKEIRVSLDNCPPVNNCEEPGTPYTIAVEVHYPDGEWTGQWHANGTAIAGENSETLSTNYPTEPGKTTKFCFVVEDKSNDHVTDSACCSLTACPDVPVDPCEEVVCGPNMEHEITGDPCDPDAQICECVCLPGYEPDPDGNGCILPCDICEDIECPENATCVEGICECDDGFVLNHEGECVPECEGDHKILVGDKCVCEDGYIEDADGNCIEECEPTPPHKHDGDCEDDVDPCHGMLCMPPKECVDGECVCPEGTIDKGGLCLPDDPCLGVLCPPNSTCNGDGNCECDEGYVPDEKGNCVMAETGECAEEPDCCPSNSVIQIVAGSGLGGGGSFRLNQPCDKTIMLWVDPKEDTTDESCDELENGMVCSCTQELQALMDIIVDMQARIDELETSVESCLESGDCPTLPRHEPEEDDTEEDD